LKENHEPWDFLVIGGGATGLGVAVDAASRGYRTVLVEQHDFAKGTSSRSTKLVHGGVRYLKQGNISLVLEALHERGLLCDNAPHLVHHLSFIVPIYSWWEGPFYGIGMKIYDRLAGKLGLEPSEILSREETLERIPTLEPNGLQRGVAYYDGQFDDSRLAINLAQTVFDRGGIAANYLKVVRLTKTNDLMTGAIVQDAETGDEIEIHAKAVINATGVFSDGIPPVKARISCCRKNFSPATAPSWCRRHLTGGSCLPCRGMIVSSSAPPTFRSNTSSWSRVRWRRKLTSSLPPLRSI